ncbi:MAG: sigma-54 dependent transcriptional regulator [Myxococcota bacterium]|nr:sigma-54 dependent transcriptional regulator [Myxococcota bacterium]
MSAKILIVDDERAVRRALSLHLTKAGYSIFTATHVNEALEVLSHNHIDLVISDIRMPGETGLSLLKNVQGSYPNTVVIMMTGQGSIPDAINAIRNGAAEFLLKPIDREALLTYVKKSLESQMLKSELNLLRKTVQNQYSLDQIVGQSPAMVQVFGLIKTVADTDTTVLLNGPTGTGKELLAKAIHYRSNRTSGPFIAVNCAALPDSLLESELFGYEIGAFTGANRQHRGRFEQASNGTILLDEIGEISIGTQIKLLRVLQEGSFQRLGGEDLIKPNARIIAATNQNLKSLIAEGKFREDLYYRLNVFEIKVPSLKARPSDIPLLVNHFVTHFATKHRKKPINISNELIDQMVQYDWPGNIRELENLIERHTLLSSEPKLEITNDPESQLHSLEREPQCRFETSLPEYLLQIEREEIINALNRNNGVQAQAAKMLGITRSNLHYRIKKLAIKVT